MTDFRKLMNLFEGKTYDGKWGTDQDFPKTGFEIKDLEKLMTSFDIHEEHQRQICEFVEAMMENKGI